jgi:hypothetical protein
MASKYRAVYGLRHGQLHQATGNTGEIPQKHIDAAMKSLNSHVKAMAELANAHKKAQE